ncbi:ABC transporter permease [Microbacterium sediminicola]|uniref:ABC transporter permease n=1 Tax=Microbacterium sediminicola TaxID=415210 RepID=A0ABP4UGL5_9MICO
MADVIERSASLPLALARPAASFARGTLIVLRRVGIALAYILVALLLWQGFIVVSGVDPLLVPAPLPVLEALAVQISSPVVWAATWVTFQEAIYGFAIGAAIGIAIAVVLSESKLLYRLVNPYVVAFQAIPKVALTPLFIVWFGFGIWSKVVLIATFTFFPVMVNMYQGLRSTTSEEEELMRVSHATRWQRFRHLRLYRSLPYLFAAFEASFVLCLTGAVLAELLGSGTSVGLGTLVQMYTSTYDMAGLFGIITLLSLFGVVFDLVVKLVAHFVLRWNRKHEH